MNQGALFAVPSSDDDSAPGGIEQSVIEALEDIEAAGLLTGKTKALGITLKKSAAAADRGLESYKLSVATAQLVKQIIESLDKLPDVTQKTGSIFDSLEATIKAMTEKALSE